MLVLRHRLAIAGVITAAVITVPAAALASGSGSPSGKPAPPHAPAGRASKSAAPAPQLNALAASARISVSQLQAGLAAMKQAGGNTAPGIAAFAASTGVSQTTAQRVVNAVTGTSASGKPAPPQAPAGRASKSAAPAPQLSALAASAGISVSQLQAGLAAMKQAGGNTAPGIAAFAASTGVSQTTAQRVVNAVTGE